MKLTPELAEKYAAYRERFFSGSLGLYCGFPANIPDPCDAENERLYQPGQPVPFMMIGEDARTKNGTYLLCDIVEHGGVDCSDNAPPANDPEEAVLKKLKFGDNTVYSSVALVNFAAEYSITGLISSLEIATDILRSFQRLGSHKKGYGEQGSAPWGLMLRADSSDWGDENENFCAYGDGDGASARQLAPSLDQ